MDVRIPSRAQYSQTSPSGSARRVDSSHCTAPSPQLDRAGGLAAVLSAHRVGAARPDAKAARTAIKALAPPTDQIRVGPTEGNRGERRRAALPGGRPRHLDADQGTGSGGHRAWLRRGCCGVARSPAWLSPTSRPSGRVEATDIHCYMYSCGHPQ